MQILQEQISVHTSRAGSPLQSQALGFHHEGHEDHEGLSSFLRDLRVLRGKYSLFAMSRSHALRGNAVKARCAASRGQRGEMWSIST